ncbi:MAG: site-2 protease family protein [Pirellulales bacterium]|nr:site-2 protease family protein [Thermoguttaceae bacterium]MDD4788639.1 site-2 protease family protein [Pirellulales bacterium]MDI9446021.1 site-2 protease family protein [Planctomycetota bacterium]NLZ01081.1 hypothetical protein [Pirellulaceae bacterium]
MLIGEPPRSGGDLVFALFGIPIRVHPFFWLIAVMLGIGLAPTLIELLIWMVAVFVAVLVHELGHALTMRLFGIEPWVTLYGLGGITSYNPAEANRVGTWGNVLISFAGPGMQFLLVAAIAGGLSLSGFELEIRRWGPLFFVFPVETVVSWGVTQLLRYTMLVCILWGAINLLPVYPLDGGQISRDVLVAADPQRGVVQSLLLSIVAAVAMVVVGVAMQNMFMILMFGFLGYGSYAAIQAYRNHRGW